MAGILEKIAGVDKLRGEMRLRVDEILKSAEEWKAAARELKESLDRLTEAIERNNSLKLDTVSRSATRLSEKTEKLIKALNRHCETLAKISKLL